MSTYLVNHLRIPGDVPGEPGLRYLEQVQATVEAFGGTWLAMGAPDQVVEGAWPGSVVLIEFPDRDAAVTWYESPEYQAILPLRTGHSISDLVLIDAVPDGFTTRAIADQVRSLQQ